jgi:hypothetical protein
LPLPGRTVVLGIMALYDSGILGKILESMYSFFAQGILYIHPVKEAITERVNVPHNRSLTMKSNEKEETRMYLSEVAGNE